MTINDARRTTTDDLLQRLRDELSPASRAQAASEAADEIERLRECLGTIQRLVDEQAEDEACWFIADSMPEAYLQQELRRLHAVIEGTS